MHSELKVLLVGATANRSTLLSKWLERRGCDNHFATSCREACRLIQCQLFDLVLSPFELPDRSAFPLFERLSGSSTTLFFSAILENGCLWIPTLMHGKRWQNARALRPGEFAIALGTAVEQARRYRDATSMTAIAS
ncbi:MAG: hypothetical protein JSS69_02430 [Acidobacteria bacterium]|nr:hypothetical protein [Acidobacteriota bacterium]MBS1864750.1 hypothetical protein [Acidobacteriota bacterium]